MPNDNITAAQLLKRAEARKIPRRTLTPAGRKLADRLVTAGQLKKTKTDNYVYYVLP